VAALDAQRELNAPKLRGVLEFLRVYADQRHHQREEAEHEKGRALVLALAEGIGA